VPNQRGYGLVRPSVIDNGADPTGLVTNVKWSSWGAAQATGEGTSVYVGPHESVAGGHEETATVVAFDLGLCNGLPMYRAARWYYPQHGETFDGKSDLDICTGTYVSHGLEPEQVASPTQSDICPHYCYSLFFANVDGKSATETVAVWSLSPFGPSIPSAGLGWGLRVTLAPGVHPDVPLSSFGRLNRAPDVLAVRDVNAEGRDEVFIVTDAGASTEFVTIFGLSGGTLKPAVFSDGTQATLSLGGSVTHLSAITCRTGPGGTQELVQTSMLVNPNRWEERAYRWSGLTLASVSDSAGTFSGDPNTSTEPHVKAAVAGLHC
jgi:hypothetical protein